ncbi:NAD-dependent epimerase/dehydratase family protein [Pararhizobium mangrovi]|uniref:NAD-dependent epimerase/dehydratase family protein n=1 Tax=Pararhizobium mangrovi TaxID=2590452 RepID=UPI0015E868A8|nr:NAD-dependent epimerase/dehydratase family protein [Pararhizobium mangrovi]
MAEGAGATLAITGATGFLGTHLLQTLSPDRWYLRALSRSGAAFRPDVELVHGSLTDDEALAALVRNAEIVVHAAGLTSARSAAEFDRVNAEGTARLARACLAHAPHAHVLLVSSLAAREPQLSAYAASKRRGEEEARRLLPADRLTVLRLPALYGPHDRATLAFFKAARLPVTPLFTNGNERIALLHGGDAAEAIAGLAALRTAGTFALADAEPAGYSMRTILDEAGRAQGRRTRFVRVPALAMRTAGWGAGAGARLFRTAAMLSPGKVREMLHPDWSVSPADLPPGTKARTLRDGFGETVAWYHKAGWLR